MTTHDPGLRRHELVRCSRLQIPSLGCRARSLHAARRRRGTRGNGDRTWSPEAVSGLRGELNRFATSEMGREGGVPERLWGSAERKTQLRPEHRHQRILLGPLSGHVRPAPGSVPSNLAPGRARGQQAPTSDMFMLQMLFRTLGAASSLRRLEAWYSREDRGTGQIGVVLGDSHP